MSNGTDRTGATGERRTRGADGGAQHERPACAPPSVPTRSDIPLAYQYGAVDPAPRNRSCLGRWHPTPDVVVGRGGVIGCGVRNGSSVHWLRTRLAVAVWMVVRSVLPPV